MFSVISNLFNQPLNCDSPCEKKNDSIEQIATSAISNYTDLESTDNAILRKKIFKQYFRYAAYMYKGLAGGISYYGEEKGILLFVENQKKGKDILNKKNPTVYKKILNTLLNMGFQKDMQGNFYHLGTGTIFNIIFDSERSELIFAFMGLNKGDLLSIDGKLKNDLNSQSQYAAIYDLMGFDHSAITQVIDIGSKMKKLTKGTSIKPVMVGHSHGGGLAQVAALANGLKGIIFNSRPLSHATVNRIGLSNSDLSENEKNIATFTVKGDWLTDHSIISQIGNLFGNMGISPPKNYGVGYLLPRPQEGSPHGYFYNSFQSLHP